jgi:branched-chain amino acid transport system substrate-binding protein
MNTSRRSLIAMVSAGAAIGLVRPASAADTIKIGMTIPMTGPGATTGKLQTEGAKLAISHVNSAGGVLGRQLELVLEDDQTTNPGMVLAFSRLVNRGDLAVILGSVRSTQVNAVAADIKKSGIPTFIGGSDPTLTHMGNPWIFRCRPNDTYSSKVIAAFGVNDLKKTKWAVVHGTDAFGASGGKLVIEQLKMMGITPVVEQGINNGQADLTPVVLAIRQSGADVLATYIAFENDVALFARQLKQFGVNIPWIGSASVASPISRNLAGPALFGSYIVSDYDAAASPQAKAFSEEYVKTYGGVIPDDQSAWPYDAVNLTVEAIKKTGGVDPAKLRDALHSIKDFPGTEGTYTFDENGDGLSSYNIVQNDNGNLKWIRQITPAK